MPVAPSSESTPKSNCPHVIRVRNSWNSPPTNLEQTILQSPKVSFEAILRLVPGGGRTPMTARGGGF